MKLVRSHYVTYLVAVQSAVVPGNACPEAGNLDKHLCPVEGEEVEVTGNLVVVPHIIGDGNIDMAL